MNNNHSVYTNKIVRESGLAPDDPIVLLYVSLRTSGKSIQSARLLSSVIQRKKSKSKKNLSKSQIAEAMFEAKNNEWDEYDEDLYYEYIYSMYDDMYCDRYD